MFTNVRLLHLGVSIPLRARRWRGQVTGYRLQEGGFGFASVDCPALTPL
jgi:hypothetical protein